MYIYKCHIFVSFTISQDLSVSSKQNQTKRICVDGDASWPRALISTKTLLVCLIISSETNLNKTKTFLIWLFIATDSRDTINPLLMYRVGSLFYDSGLLNSSLALVSSNLRTTSSTASEAHRLLLLTTTDSLYCFGDYPKLWPYFTSCSFNSSWACDWFFLPNAVSHPVGWNNYGVSYFTMG